MAVGVAASIGCDNRRPDEDDARRVLGLQRTPAGALSALQVQSVHPLLGMASAGDVQRVACNGPESIGARPVADGAASLLWAALLEDDGPTGGFFRDGRELPMVANRRAPSTPKAKRRAGAELERVEVQSRTEWRRWLEAHHRQPNGIWLVTYKKAADPNRFLSYGDIVEEAICFGWVDSLPHTLDAKRSMRLVAPRRPKSAWSAVNKARVESLIAAKKMAPSGLAAVERAKADGSWSKLDGVEALVTPPDLMRELARRGRAAEHFASFPRSSKRIILEWIAGAKTDATRRKRVEETARKAAENRRANHWRQSQ